MPNTDSQRASGARQRVSYADVLRCVANELCLWSPAAKLGMHTDIYALRALAGLLEKITEAVATDERAMTLTDPSARSSEQQYAEEEILSAAASIAFGFDPASVGSDL